MREAGVFAFPVGLRSTTSLYCRCHDGDARRSGRHDQGAALAHPCGDSRRHRAHRAITLAAFPGPAEAGLIDALRADAEASVDGLSQLAVDAHGRPVAHALLTRCTVGGEPALALAPCSTLPEFQRQGAGGAAIRAALDAARQQEENLVLALDPAQSSPRGEVAYPAAFGVWLADPIGRTDMGETRRA